MYIVPGNTTVAHPLRPKKGTRTVPFLSSPAGLVTPSTGSRAAVCTFLYIVPGDTTVAPLLRPEKGTRTVPFLYPALRGFLHHRPGQEQERIIILSLDPGSTCKFVNIYPRPPVASYSNPKDSISSSPAFLYCIMCTCTSNSSRGDLGALRAPKYSTVQYNTVQYITVQYSTVQYSTVQYSTVQYSTVQYSTVQYSTVQYSTVQYSTVLTLSREPALRRR